LACQIADGNAPPPLVGRKEVVAGKIGHDLLMETAVEETSLDELLAESGDDSGMLGKGEVPDNGQITITFTRRVADPVKQQQQVDVRTLDVIATRI